MQVVKAGSAVSDRRLMVRRMMLLALAVASVAFLAVVNMARAQGLGLPDPSTWFLSTAAWGVVASFLVSTIRANFLPNVKGVAAIVLTFAVSVAGAVIASTGILSFAGISLEVSGTLEAVLFGLVSGGIALGWYDGTAAIANIVGRTIADANAATLALVTSAAAGGGIRGPVGVSSEPLPHQVPVMSAASVNPESVMDFILSLVKSRFGGLDKVPVFVWGIVQTLASEFAGQVLTPELRRTIQRRLLDLLAAAGGSGRDL